MHSKLHITYKVVPQLLTIVTRKYLGAKILHNTVQVPQCRVYVKLNPILHCQLRQIGNVKQYRVNFIATRTIQLIKVPSYSWSNNKKWNLAKYEQIFISSPWNYQGSRNFSVMGTITNGFCTLISRIVQSNPSHRVPLWTVKSKPTGQLRQVQDARVDECQQFLLAWKTPVFKQTFSSLSCSEAFGSKWVGQA